MPRAAEFRRMRRRGLRLLQPPAPRALTGKCRSERHVLRLLHSLRLLGSIRRNGSAWVPALPGSMNNDQHDVVLFGELLDKLYWGAGHP